MSFLDEIDEIKRKPRIEKLVNMHHTANPKSRPLNEANADSLAIIIEIRRHIEENPPKIPVIECPNGYNYEVQLAPIDYLIEGDKEILETGIHLIHYCPDKGCLTRHEYRIPCRIALEKFTFRVGLTTFDINDPDFSKERVREQAAVELKSFTYLAMSEIYAGLSHTDLTRPANPTKTREYVTKWIESCPIDHDENLLFRARGEATVAHSLLGIIDRYPDETKTTLNKLVDIVIEAKAAGENKLVEELNPWVTKLLG